MRVKILCSGEIRKAETLVSLFVGSCVTQKIFLAYNFKGKYLRPGCFLLIIALLTTLKTVFNIIKPYLQGTSVTFDALLDNVNLACG
jgi:hypothetical protein